MQGDHIIRLEKWNENLLSITSTWFQCLLVFPAFLVYDTFWVNTAISAEAFNVRLNLELSLVQILNLHEVVLSKQKTKHSCDSIVPSVHQPSQGALSISAVQSWTVCISFAWAHAKAKWINDKLMWYKVFIFAYVMTWISRTSWPIFKIVSSVCTDLNLEEKWINLMSQRIAFLSVQYTFNLKIWALIFSSKHGIIIEWIISYLNTCHWGSIPCLNDE